VALFLTGFRTGLEVGLLGKSGFWISGIPGFWVEIPGIPAAILRIAFGTRLDIIFRTAWGTIDGMALEIGLKTGFWFSDKILLSGIEPRIEPGLLGIVPGFWSRFGSASDSGSFEPKSSGFRSSNKGLTGVEVVSFEDIQTDIVYWITFKILILDYTFKY
jgi:hypothetical protein